MSSTFRCCARKRDLYIMRAPGAVIVRRDADNVPLPLTAGNPTHRRETIRAGSRLSGCILWNADGISSKWNSVGLVHESPGAALGRKRRMRTQQIRGRLIIVTVSTAFVSIRVIRGPSFLCPRITRMNANPNPLSGESHSVQAGLPDSEFPIPNSTVFRPRRLGTDYKVANAPKH